MNTNEHEFLSESQITLMVKAKVGATCSDSALIRVGSCSFVVSTAFTNGIRIIRGKKTLRLQSARTR